MLGKFVTSVFTLCWFLPALAAPNLPWRTPSQEDNAPSFFKDNYVVLEMVKNQPYASSQNQFSPGTNSVFVGFRHVLRDKWLMGVHTGFKKFKLRDEGSNLSIFTLLQETQMLYRLNHPFYISIGPKLMLLVPARGNKIPPEKEPFFSREVGFAGSASLHYAASKFAILSLRVDRWRGVNTAIFQGTETAFGVNVAIP